MIQTKDNKEPKFKEETPSLLWLFPILYSLIYGYNRSDCIKVPSWLSFKLSSSSISSFLAHKNLRKLYLLLETILKKIKTSKFWEKNYSKKFNKHGSTFQNHQENKILNLMTYFLWKPSSYLLKFKKNSNLQLQLTNWGINWLKVPIKNNYQKKMYQWKIFLCICKTYGKLLRLIRTLISLNKKFFYRTWDVTKSKRKFTKISNNNSEMSFKNHKEKWMKISETTFAQSFKKWSSLTINKHRDTFNKKLIK